MKMSLGVSADLIEQHGVISNEVAEAMAAAARRNLDADYGIGITGIVGNDEVEGKPPGTMHISVAGQLGPAEAISYTFYQAAPPPNAARRHDGPLPPSPTLPRPRRVARAPSVILSKTTSSIGSPSVAKESGWRWWWVRRPANGTISTGLRRTTPRSAHGDEFRTMSGMPPRGTQRRPPLH
jgi:hypothetical protein